MAHTQKKTAADSSWRKVLQDLLNEAGLTPNACGVGSTVPREPGWSHPERPARHYRRYGTPFGPLFRHFRPDVDEPAIEIRFGHSRGRGLKPDTRSHNRTTSYYYLIRKARSRIGPWNAIHLFTIGAP